MYNVIIVGGKRDGETLETFCDKDKAIKFASDYLTEHEAELHPTWGGTMIIDTATNQTIEF